MRKQIPLVLQHLVRLVTIHTPILHLLLMEIQVHPNLNRHRLLEQRVLVMQVNLSQVLLVSVLLVLVLLVLGLLLPVRQLLGHRALAHRALDLLVSGLLALAPPASETLPLGKLQLQSSQTTRVILVLPVLVLPVLVQKTKVLSPN